MRHTTIVSILLSTLIWTTNARSSKKITCFDKAKTPKLTLPWGTYEGKPYGEDGETVLFNNVRFAKPPLGELRFAAPEYPDPISDSSQIQDSSSGPNCIQALPVASSKQNRHILEDPEPDFPEPLANETRQSEDCLFLDVYVPAWALEPDNDEKLPVIVWIYGGAYIFGGKNTTLDTKDGPYNAYDGEGIRQFTDQNVIWVTGNYRLGAFGFLAGRTMEALAQPNAGLHDQRLLLDWVQKYIGQVGGDKKAVNVWGLSAGAGSILHHLTAYGGTKDETPLFARAALWSTAFQWSYDRSGTLEDTFNSFADAAGCSDFDCLREVDPDTLSKANQQVVSDRLAKGMFPFGPAIDGDLVPNLPAVSLKLANHVNVSSMMLAHNFDESRMFLADWVKTEDDFSKFLEYAFPGPRLTIVRNTIAAVYPSSAYVNQQERTRILLRDSTFVCNNYQIYQAYKGTSQIYASRYEIPPAQHGSELMLLIWNRNADAASLISALAPKLPDFLVNFLSTILTPLASRYQQFFAGHAIAGDPNYFTGGRFINWDVTTDDGDQLTNVMRTGIQFINPSFYRLGPDSQVSASNCRFWDLIAQMVSGEMGGYGESREELKEELKRLRTQDPESKQGFFQVEL